MIYASEQSILNAQWNAAFTAELVEIERLRPSMLLKPRLCIDGNQWCALYGENLQDGVAGFGDSPKEAIAAFDVMWSSKLDVQRLSD